jgi:hypothetical protein
VNGASPLFVVVFHGERVARPGAADERGGHGKHCREEWVNE